MAIKYLRSGATGAADGSSMANAHTTIAAAIAGLSAGDTLLVASDHTQALTAALTMTFPGTQAAPVNVISVDPVTEAYSPGASFSTASHDITVGGGVVIEGVNFAPGTAPTSNHQFSFGQTSNADAILRDSLITLANNHSARCNVGGLNGRVIWDNVTVNVNNANGWTVGPLLWKNSTPYTGTIPDNLLDAFAGNQTFDGCDLSAFNGKVLRRCEFGYGGMLILRNCKLPATYTALSSQWGRADSVSIVNCSKASGPVMREEHDYSGVSSISTVVYRTGGASDGAASFSNKVLVNAGGTSSGASRHWPCHSLDVNFHVGAADVGVSKTLTAYLLATVADGSAGVALAANEAWIEIDYLADAGSLDSARASSGPPNGRTSGAAPVADASTWTSTGLTAPTGQRVSKAFTPQKAGMHRARVALARPDTALFVDPKMVLA